MSSDPSVRKRRHSGRHHGRPRALASLGVVLAGSLVAACANLDGAGPPPRQSGLGSIGGGQGPTPMGGGLSSGGLSGSGPSTSSREGPRRAASALDEDGGGAPAVTSRPAGTPDWVAVYESPREARYDDQVVIYVDKANLQVQQLEQYTYYLARTRQIGRSSTTPRIQEIAVLCEGSPIAPATSLRGEGTEDRSGNYSIRQASAPLASIDQFSTQKVRIDPGNPNTFVIRAICLLGTERSG